MTDEMTPQKIVEYAVWYARKKKGAVADVARALLEEFPWLREPLAAAALGNTSTSRSVERSIAEMQAEDDDEIRSGRRPANIPPPSGG